MSTPKRVWTISDGGSLSGLNTENDNIASIMNSITKDNIEQTAKISGNQFRDGTVNSRKFNLDLSTGGSSGVTTLTTTNQTIVTVSITTQVPIYAVSMCYVNFGAVTSADSFGVVELFINGVEDASTSQAIVGNGAASNYGPQVNQIWLTELRPATHSLTLQARKLAGAGSMTIDLAILYVWQFAI